MECTGLSLILTFSPSEKEWQSTGLIGRASWDSVPRSWLSTVKTGTGPEKCVHFWRSKL